MKLEYTETENREVVITRDGHQVGRITGGEVGIDIRSKKFWEVATGQRECSPARWSYWLKDLRTEEYVNNAPLSTINQAKALAEYHFIKD